MLIGFWFARKPLVAAVFDPYVKMINALPRVVLAPIFALWLGLGIWSKVALGVTLVFFIVFFNVYQGVKEVSPTMLANARMLGMNERQLMRHVYWPSALSWMFSSLHTAVGFAVVGAVVGEYLGSAAGLGYLIQQAEGVFDVAGVFAGMFVLAAFVCHRLPGHAGRTAAAGLAPGRGRAAHLMPFWPFRAKCAQLCCGINLRRNPCRSFCSAALALVLAWRWRRRQVKVTIAVGGAGCLCYLPTMLAEQLGEYEKAGVNAELINFKGGSQALTAVLGGSADVVSGYFDHCVNLAAKNQAMQAFVVYDRYPGFALVVSPKPTSI